MAVTTPTNPNVVWTVQGRLGVNLNRRTNSTTETQPVEHALGEFIIDNNGKVWVYVFAPNGFDSNQNVTVTFAGTVQATTIATKTTLNWINGTAAFKASDYGWVQSVRRLGETNYKP